MPPRRTRTRAAALMACTVCLLPMGAQAQDSGWTYRFTGYLFAAETTTQVGQLETVLKFSDALEDLDFAVMGTFEAQNGPWSLIADYAYFDLTFSTDTPGPGFTGADTNVTNQYLSAYAAYRIYGDARTRVDVGAGVRWFDTDTQITLTGGSTARGASAGDDWVDPLVMVRGSKRLSDRWTASVFLDYGGFSSDSETYQVVATFAYALNRRWDLGLGYRYIEVDHEIDGRSFGFSQSGPVVGFTYRF
jgi:hypothetical protein